MTNGTIKTTDTSILDTPPRPSRQERSRLSFLQRNKHDHPPVSLKPNGNNRGDDASSTRSHSKENRRSFFGGNRDRRNSVEAGDGGDGDWVTDSGFDGTPDKSSAGHGGMRRSGSSHRPNTESGQGEPGTGMHSRVGSVRKRFSMLKLGKKNNKAAVMVDSVAEE